MRRPGVAAASTSLSLTSTPLAINSNIRRINPSVGSLTSYNASLADSGRWSLPPLNHYMTLPRNLMPSRFINVVDNFTSSSSNESNSQNENRTEPTFSSVMNNLLNNEDAEFAHDHFLLPPLAHWQNMVDTNDTASEPVDRPEEIDLTLLSSDEDEDGVQNITDGGDIFEILDASDTPGISLPVPFCRKRRRPGSSELKVLVPKRQRMADKMRSAESTNINIQNSEVVEEFKRRLKCSICLDVLQDMTSTICGHIFCAGCIDQAVRANGKCPLCQRHVHPKDTHRLYF